MSNDVYDKILTSQTGTPIPRERPATTGPMQLITFPYTKWGMSLPLRLSIVIGFLISNIGLAVCVALYSQNLISIEIAGIIFAGTVLFSSVVAASLKGIIANWANETTQPMSQPLETAWNQCLKKTRDWSITLQDKPLILMIGFRDADHATSFMSASDEEFAILSESKEQGAFQLFGSEDANFLAISGVSSLSNLVLKYEESHARNKGQSNVNVDPDKDVFEDTVFEQDFVEQGATIDLVVPREDFDKMMEGYEEDHHHATINNPNDISDGRAMNTMMQKSRLASIALTSDELDDLGEQLRAFLQHLGLARTPCPTIDSLVVNLPFELLAKDELEEPIEKALQHDIRSIRESLDVLFPVYVVVGGLERESGFRELVRRIGRNRVKKHRFGSGFEAWGIPTIECLEVLCDKSCTAFEEWIFYLFKEEGGIRKRGNPKLYTLLCQIRGKIRERLHRLVGRVFSVSENADEVPCLFSGCYFAATGNREDQQAFVRGIFKRMTTNTSKGFWTKQAIERDRTFMSRRNLLHNINLVLVVILASGICGLFLQIYK